MTASEVRPAFHFCNNNIHKESGGKNGYAYRTLELK